jgi:gamma-glutamyl:cysteine ligase YbdK (ATP-grasp superfamily)
LTAAGPLPVRIRQHRVTQQMLQRPARDRDLQFIGVGLIPLHHLARQRVLREEHFLVLAVLQTPG